MTQPSMPSSRTNVWVKMLQAIGICLVVEFGLFAIIKYVLHVTWGELFPSCLAFALPTVVVLLAAWGLRNWEGHSLSPRWLALGWGLCVALFVSMLIAAVVFTGMKLRLINSSDLDVWGIASAVCILSASLAVYRQTYRIMLQRYSTSVANDTDDSRV